MIAPAVCYDVCLRTKNREVVQFAYAIKLCISNTRKQNIRTSSLGKCLAGCHICCLSTCAENGARTGALICQCWKKCLARRHKQRAHDAYAVRAHTSPRVVAYRLARRRVAGAGDGGLRLPVWCLHLRCARARPS